MSVNCPSDILSDKEFFAAFGQRVKRERIPVSGGIGLTDKCNLKCVHCYVADRSDNLPAVSEMSTDEVTGVLDQIAEAGCLFLYFTGGDPLLRKDFSEIYSHAKRRGMAVTVLSNATTVTDSIAELFSELPPRAVDISLYGATPETYESITGVTGSFDRCIAGIEKLVARNIRVALKTVLLKLNSHELLEIKAIARRYGALFRFDSGIHPRFDGDKGPLDMRLSPAEVVACETEERDVLQSRIDFVRERNGLALSDRVYRCGAGKTGFYINASGKLLPCIMSTRFDYDLMKGSFADGWTNYIPAFYQKAASPGNRCAECSMIAMCDYCPLFFALENNNEESPSDFLCSVGRLRYNLKKEEIFS